MSVLFVCSCIPFEYGGGSQATTAYLDAIVDIFRNEQVDVLAPEETIIPKGYEQVNFIKVKKRNKLSGLWGMGMGVLGRFAEPTLKLLRTNPNKYKLCVFNGSRESGYVAKRVRNLPVKFATIHHNDEIEYNMDTKALYTLWGIYPGLINRLQRNAYIYSDYNLFLTQQDKLSFADMYGDTKAKNEVIGTYDFKSAQVISLQNTPKDFNFVISGTLEHYQTTHGIVDFYQNYYQLLLKHSPEAKILLTGRNPSERIKQITDSESEHFSIVASPVDIHKEVRRASIYICPTDIGGGLKLRAMDALKNGLPILVHRVSARGYDAFFNQPYFKVYSDKESFEKGLVQLLSYIKQTANFSSEINKDYYDYFGYSAGKFRTEIALL